MISRHLSGWTPQFCGCWEFPLIYLFSSLGQTFYVKCIFSSSFKKLFFLRMLIANAESLILKRQSLVSGFVLLHSLVSYMTLMMPLGAMSRWVSKGCVPQTGYRWCVGPVLSGPGIKWCSSTPYCSIHLCRVGSRRMAQGRGGLP